MVKTFFVVSGLIIASTLALNTDKMGCLQSLPEVPAEITLQSPIEMTAAPEGSYVAKRDCDNCEKESSLVIEKGTEVEEFVEESNPVCTNCGCQISPE